MRTLKKLPGPGWRWFKSEFAKERDEWVPAHIKYFAQDGLLFCSWHENENHRVMWKFVSRTKPSEWGEPITKRKKVKK